MLGRTRRLRPLFLLVGLTGLVFPALPSLFEEEPPHACVCPLDADGHCECIACNLLEIHGPRRDLQRPLGPTLSGCTERERAVVSQVSFEPAVALPEMASISPAEVRLVAASADSPLRGPDRPRLDRPPKRG